MEARRARTTANFTAAQGVTVAGHVHPEVRPASILFTGAVPLFGGGQTQQASGG